MSSAITFFNSQTAVLGVQDQSAPLTIDGVTYWNIWGSPHIENFDGDRSGILFMTGIDKEPYQLSYQTFGPFRGVVRVSIRGATDSATCFVSYAEPTSPSDPYVLDEDFSGC